MYFKQKKNAETNKSTHKNKANKTEKKTRSGAFAQDASHVASVASLSALGPQNRELYFVLVNGVRLMQPLFRDSAQFSIDESQLFLKVVEDLTMGLVVGAILVIFLVLVCVVRPSVFQVEEGKSQVILIFLDIPGNIVMEIVHLYQNRVATFDSTTLAASASSAGGGRGGDGDNKDDDDDDDDDDEDEEKGGGVGYKANGINGGAGNRIAPAAGGARAGGVVNMRLGGAAHAAATGGGHHHHHHEKKREEKRFRSEKLVLTFKIGLLFVFTFAYFLTSYVGGFQRVVPVLRNGPYERKSSAGTYVTGRMHTHACIRIHACIRTHARMHACMHSYGTARTKRMGQRVGS